MQSQALIRCPNGTSLLDKVKFAKADFKAALKDHNESSLPSADDLDSSRKNFKEPDTPKNNQSYNEDDIVELATPKVARESTYKPDEKNAANVSPPRRNSSVKKKNLVITIETPKKSLTMIDRSRRPTEPKTKQVKELVKSGYQRAIKRCTRNNSKRDSPDANSPGRKSFMDSKGLAGRSYTITVGKLSKWKEPAEIPLSSD